MVNKSCLFFSVLCFVFLSSCGEYELLEHQNECKRVADSMYRAEVKQIKSITDSLCELHYDSYRQSALDSLIPARKAAVEKLFSK